MRERRVVDDDARDGTMQILDEAIARERGVLIIGSGPIVIGQAAEFDFSGSQAAQALKKEGYRTILVNSNPATIQTDPDTADAVYIEPLSTEYLEAIIARERPWGLLGGMGGQTGLNLASELAETGILERYGVRLLGTSAEAIALSEDRELFRRRMSEIGEPLPRSATAGSLEEASAIADRLGYPVLVRPAYTLGGTGGGIANDPGELIEIAGRGLAYSRINQVLIEESVLGWAEYEYEVVRDGAGSTICICSMENLDAMGVHTGESIVVAPVLTLSDQDHQRLRTAALRIIDALDIEGGCNVQFAFHQPTGDYRVIEVNPRVSRSSALASKATGFPIARTAALIAIGKRLDEIPNPLTGSTLAAFEPTLDYVVVKIPRWPFDKFASIERGLGTQMKSTGEVMALGRSFEAALLKGYRSLELKGGWPRTLEVPGDGAHPEAELETLLVRPNDRRLEAVFEALREGWTIDRVAESTRWDPFFVNKCNNIIDVERELKACGGKPLPPGVLERAKVTGLSDEHIASLLGVGEERFRQMRLNAGYVPTYRMVDTCGGEFAAATPYFYSTFDEECEVRPRIGADSRRQVIVLGSGPIRIGQGIEFDYSCVHAVAALKARGLAAVMVNCNPETVSTDFDVSDRLYFEPLTFEEVCGILEAERPWGLICQFGGQTAVNLAARLEAYIAQRGLPTRLLGTSPAAMALAEDRAQFGDLMEGLGVAQPPGATGTSYARVAQAAARIGYPVLVRPSFVLGGRAMEVVQDDTQLESYMAAATDCSPEAPVLVDRFLDPALELDVDGVCDGRQVLIGAVMEHIEMAGVHSGDSACVTPPRSLGPDQLRRLMELSGKVALGLQTVGSFNLQWALHRGEFYIIEANPRASRTFPYVSKAVGLPLAQLATRVMLEERLEDLSDLIMQDRDDGTGVWLPRMPERRPGGPGWSRGPQGGRDAGPAGPVDTNTLPAVSALGTHPHQTVAVKVPVFPFLKLTGLDAVLGPEMKSTGESMGLAESFGEAYGRAMAAAGKPLPRGGAVYLTVRDRDKAEVVYVARDFVHLGFRLLASQGTAAVLRQANLEVEAVWRIEENRQPDVLGLMRAGKVDLIINTPTATSGAVRDGAAMRRLAVELQIPFITTMAGAQAAAEAITARHRG